MLTTQELKTLAPAAFATSPAAHCSPRYRMFPTTQVVELLAQEGFVPVEARQDRSRSAEVDPAHARHLVRFRLPGVSDRKTSAVGELSADIILINSSDGRTPFSLDMGVFRKVCSNGMVARVSGDKLHQPHEHVTAESVLQRAMAISKQSKPLFDKIKHWSGIRLDASRTAAFAQRAAELRWDDKAGMYVPADLIAPRREEDREDTLWNIFNRAQENGMRGGVTGQTAAGRRVTTRAIGSIDGEMTFNTRLWELADEFAG